MGGDEMGGLNRRIRERLRWEVSVALALVLLWGSGCGVTQYSRDTRALSFARLDGLAMSEGEMRNHVVWRTGIVMHGAEFDSDDALEVNSTQQSREFGVGEEIALCAAAAVDSRGYFVTAAHCLESDEFTLTFPGPDGPVAVRPRVVWSGRPSVFGFDFALLHAPSGVDQVFEWADAPEVGDVAISCGAVIDALQEDGVPMIVEVMVEPTGGHILKRLSRSIGHDMKYDLLLHDCPIIRGYSGGPLVNREGKLVGINFGGRTRWPLRWNDRMRYSNAIRPDLEWIQRLIEEDQARLASGMRP